MRCTVRIGRLLERPMTRLGLSARAYDRILKVSRTIADLKSSGASRYAHVAEAVVTVHSIAGTGVNRKFRENVAAAEEIQYLLGRVRQRRA
ncbi:MAG TPA: hypothetical protein VKC61_05090 [Pyrinomonadaceae bacterium]|nr:hypothetical protein [Pyrinomonadaceae bacterium]